MRPFDSTPAAKPDRPSHARPARSRTLRILCLHGYHGSGRALQEQMAALVSGLEPLADFVVVDAPSLASGDYGWWHAVDAEGDPTSDDPGVDGPRRRYEGWARTRDAIVARVRADGPFDGVFGFSQGAALAGLLVGLRAPDGEPTDARPLTFDFAMMVGGFSSNDPELARLYERHDGYALPSLHVFGRSDGIVPMVDSRALAARFERPVLVEHGGGHIVPGDAAVQARVRAFLDERLRATWSDDGESLPPSLELPLWNESGSPAIRVVLPKGGRTGRVAALVVFRGGGYVTNRGSGDGSAEWAAENGMVGVEVPYRIRGTDGAFPGAFDDAARAVRLVRAHASEWGIDVARVGVLGFSAGGHLASLLSTQPALRANPADDLASRIGARPDFVVLAYPVVSFVEGYEPGAYAGSAASFFGQADIAPEQRRQFSNELHVAPDHPPVFVWTTAEDALVPASHARLFAEACERAGVPVAFTLFPHGPHGMGLARGDRSDVGTWTSRLRAWLVARGIVGGP